jgi:cytochrome c biogenesis protein CcmG/thiol:disulfide interchange protein DsbE
MPRLLFILPLLLFGAIAAYFAVGLTKDPRKLPSALIDKPAPEFDLPPLYDAKPGLAKADLGGEVKLVNVFASWCVPCKVEHPVLMRFSEQNDTPLYGINYKDATKDAVAWLGQLGDPYQRIGQDLSGRVGIEWGVYGVPETYVVDREGRIRYRHVGPVLPDALEEKILPLIEELKR